MVTQPCNVLLVYPRFAADTFWNFAETCALFGAKYPAPPLGLITVAAMLPPSWTVRLIDRNAEELTARGPRMGRPRDDGRHAAAAARYARRR